MGPQATAAGAPISDSPTSEAATVVEDALDDGDYLVGGRFTVADLVCGAVLIFARHAELLERMPRIADYLERLEARPARERANAVGAA